MSSWKAQALCAGADQDLFFPSRPGGGHFRYHYEETAKAICAQCPVRVPCLSHALEEREPVGIWGGLLPEERGIGAAEDPMVAASTRARRAALSEEDADLFAGVSAEDQAVLEIALRDLTTSG